MALSAALTSDGSRMGGSDQLPDAATTSVTTKYSSTSPDAARMNKGEGKDDHWGAGDHMTKDNMCGDHTDNMCGNDQVQLQEVLRVGQSAPPDNPCPVPQHAKQGHPRSSRSSRLHGTCTWDQAKVEHSNNIHERAHAPCDSVARRTPRPRTLASVSSWYLENHIKKNVFLD